MVQEEIPQVRILPPGEFVRLIRRAHLHPTTKLIAEHVSSYASSSGKRIFPGEKLIAAELGRTTRCVREHMKILRDKGLLTRVRHNSGRWQVHDEYWLSWPLDTDRVPMRLGPDRDLLIKEGDRVRLYRDRTNEKKRSYV